MFKITAVVSLLLIGSTLWAASLSCDSCGSECASACGTRHFRSCCFNYLRKKRGSDSFKVWTQNHYDNKAEGGHRQKIPYFMIDDTPESWNAVANDIKLYPYEDTVENRLQTMYDM